MYYNMESEKDTVVLFDYKTKYIDNKLLIYSDISHLFRTSGLVKCVYLMYSIV